jgi:group I intron endonuclease
MGYIYKITNIVTGKCYIGETIQPNHERRWNKHLNSLNYKEGCPVLKASMKKHGIKNFKFEILIICFDADLVRYEKEYIKKYNSQIPNGYNILSGGQIGDGMVGYTHSPETILKIIQKGKEFREKNPNYFETYREKHKDALNKIDLSSRVKNSEKFKKAIEEKRVGSASRTGGKLSEETKKKISKGLNKYYATHSNNENCTSDKHKEAIRRALSKPVLQYNKNGELIKEYPSITEADRTSGVKRSNIHNSITGKTKTAGGGFIWKYKENIA